MVSSFEGVSVNAWFVMLNTGDQDETMEVVFPLEDLNLECLKINEGDGLSPNSSYYQFIDDSFAAEVDGVPVESHTMSGPHPYEQEPECEGYTNKLMNWAAFDVTFPVGEEVTVHVTYFLDFYSNDHPEEIYSLGYTLETGAAWKGPIGDAIIVARFPFVVEEGLLQSGTTSDYEIEENEVTWTYQKFEPTSQDNINLSFISPYYWNIIQEMSRRIEKDPQDDTAYAELGNIYAKLAFYHGGLLSSPEYYDQAKSIFEAGLLANPTSSAINANMANLILTDKCYHSESDQYDECRDMVLPYLKQGAQGDLTDTNWISFFLNFGEILNDIQEYIGVDPMAGYDSLQATEEAAVTPDTTDIPVLTLTATLVPTKTPRPQSTLPTISQPAVMDIPDTGATNHSL